MKFKKLLYTLCLSLTTITSVTAFTTPLQAMDLTQTLTQTVLGDITIEVPNYGTIKSDNLTLTKVSDKEIYVSTSSKQMQSDFNFDSFSKGLETSLKALPDKYISTIQSGTLKSMPAVVASINIGNSGLILVNFYSNNTVHNVNILYAGSENYKEAYSLIAKISLTSGKESIVIKPSTPTATTHVDKKVVEYDLPAGFKEDSSYLKSGVGIPRYSDISPVAGYTKENTYNHYSFVIDSDTTGYKNPTPKHLTTMFSSGIEVNSNFTLKPSTIKLEKHDDRSAALMSFSNDKFITYSYLIADPGNEQFLIFSYTNDNPDSSKRNEGYDEFLEFIKTIKVK